MRNQFLNPGFLFDFYSDRGSTATPFGRSNVSWCGLILFRAETARTKKIEMCIEMAK